MRIPHRNRSGKWEFNMTPMIDIVFLLIIFFLVSSHLARQENEMELPLPVAQEGNEPATSLGDRVTVNLTHGGQILLGGRPVLPEELSYRLGVENERAKRRHMRLEVRIRGDRRVPYSQIRPVLSACQTAGIARVSFSVIRYEEIR